MQQLTREVAAAWTGSTSLSPTLAQPPALVGSQRRRRPGRRLRAQTAFTPGRALEPHGTARGLPPLGEARVTTPTGPATVPVGVMLGADHGTTPCC
nr:hypothetical protein [Cellulosimicrobium sp. MM]